jgi:hypothetical protein
VGCARRSWLWPLNKTHSTNFQTPLLCIYTKGPKPEGNTILQEFVLTGVACTPSRMCGNIIKASIFLPSDRTMGCFPFLLTGVLEVPAFGSLSSTPNSGFPGISSICTSSYCVGPAIGCGLTPIELFCLLAPPFIMWDTSTLTFCCGLPMSTSLQPYAMSCRSISILTFVEACSSSSTREALIGLTYDDGIALTLMIPSLYVSSCSTSIVSCGNLRLLQVFHVI